MVKSALGESPPTPGLPGLAIVSKLPELFYSTLLDATRLNSALWSRRYYINYLALVYSTLLYTNCPSYFSGSCSNFMYSAPPGRQTLLYDYYLLGSYRLDEIAPLDNIATQVSPPGINNHSRIEPPSPLDFSCFLRSRGAVWLCLVILRGP